MSNRTIALNINTVLLVLLIASVAVSAYMYLHVQGAFGILREYNARSTLVKSDITDMSEIVQEWRNAISYEETYLNHPYLKSIADSYNEHIPEVRQNLVDYRGFLQENRDLLVSVSINAPLETKNIDALLDTYDRNVDDFSKYLQNVLDLQANASAYVTG